LIQILARSGRCRESKLTKRTKGQKGKKDWDGKARVIATALDRAVPQKTKRARGRSFGYLKFSSERRRKMKGGEKRGINQDILLLVGASPKRSYSPGDNWLERRDWRKMLRFRGGGEDHITTCSVP